MEPDIAERPPAIFMTSGHPVAVPTGLEPATSGLTGRRELQTSPRDHSVYSVFIRIRCGIRVHSHCSNRTPNGIRTRAATLKGWCPRPLDDGGLRQWPLLVESDQNLAGALLQSTGRSRSSRRNDRQQHAERCPVVLVVDAVRGRQPVENARRPVAYRALREPADATMDVGIVHECVRRSVERDADADRHERPRARRG